MIVLHSHSLLLPVVLLLILHTTAEGVSLHTSSDWIATSAQSDIILADGDGEMGAGDCSAEGTLKNLKRRGRLNNRQHTPGSSCTWQTPLRKTTAPAAGTENRESPAGQQNLPSKPDKIPVPAEGTKLSPQDLYQWFYGPGPFSNPCGKNPRYAQYIIPVCHPVLEGGINLPFAVPEEEMTSFGLTSNDYPRGWLSPCRQLFSPAKCDPDEEFWCCQSIINRRFSFEGGSDQPYIWPNAYPLQGRNCIYQFS